METLAKQGPGVGSTMRMSGAAELSQSALRAAPMAGAHCRGRVSGQGKADEIDTVIAVRGTGECSPSVRSGSPRRATALGGTNTAITGPKGHTNRASCVYGYAGPARSTYRHASRLLPGALGTRISCPQLREDASRHVAPRGLISGEFS